MESKTEVVYPARIVKMRKFVSDTFSKICLIIANCPLQES